MMRLKDLSDYAETPVSCEALLANAENMDQEELLAVYQKILTDIGSNLITRDDLHRMLTTGDYFFLADSGSSVKDHFQAALDQLKASMSQSLKDPGVAHRLKVIVEKAMDLRDAEHSKRRKAIERAENPFPRTLTLEEKTGFVETIAISRDGKKLATGFSAISGTSNGINLWSEGNALALDRNESPDHIAFTSDGRYLSATFVGRTLKTWDTSNGTSVNIAKKKSSRPFTRGRLIALAPSGDFFIQLEPGESRAYLIDVATLKILFAFGADEPLTSVGISDDSRYALADTESGHLLVRDIRTGNQLYDLDLKDIRWGSYPGTKSVSFSPNGKKMTIDTGERQLIVWDLAADNKDADFSGYVTQNGKYILSRGNTSFSIYDVDSKTTRQSERYVSPGVLDPIASPDPEIALVTTDDGFILIYSLNTGDILDRWKVPSKHGAQKAFFSPDGKYVLARSQYDRLVHAFRLDHYDPEH